MQEKIVELVAATMELTTYIEENQVFDKMADCGCGGVDTYRSDQFGELWKNARKLAGELSTLLRNSSSP
jgi:hypothetical protein